MHIAHERVQSSSDDKERLSLAAVVYEQDAAVRRRLREELSPRRDPYQGKIDLMALPSPWNEDGIPLGSQHGSILWDNARLIARPLPEGPFDGVPGATIDPEASRWITTPSDILAPGQDIRVAEVNRQAHNDRDDVIIAALASVEAAAEAAAKAAAELRSRNADLDARIKKAKRAAYVAAKAGDMAAVRKHKISLGILLRSQAG